MNIVIEFIRNNLDTLSKFAILGGFIFTGVTFFVTSKRLKHSEQIKMAHDISKEITEAENAVLSIPSEQFAYEDIKRKRHLQYLNVWEWFAFLVNHDEIDDDEIINHFKPDLLKAYKEILGNYEDLKTSEKSFEQIKILCNEWNKKSSSV